jgi:sugar phosphate isomerase/epimerase
MARATLASAAAALAPWRVLPAAEVRNWPPPIAVFSKVYQTLKLNYEDSAALTAEAGLDGIDCTVRPGGEVLPERVADDLPRYADALRRHKVQLLLLTTGILGPATPHTETLLRTAKKLGIRYYRLGSWQYAGERLPDALRREIQSQLKDLAALNKELGLCAVLQNHSPGGRKYVGGDLAELHDIVKDFNVEQIAVAFDIGHALIVHGEDWPPHFEKLQPHIQVAYVKDARRPKSFVPFGEGGIAGTDFFPRLKRMGCTAPLSMHIEFEWTNKNDPQPRASLLKALQNSRRVLADWLARA